jgi:hypothetical protein
MIQIHLIEQKYHRFSYQWCRPRSNQSKKNVIKSHLEKSPLDMGAKAANQVALTGSFGI